MHAIYITVRIYTADHPPPHVHVVAPDAEAKYDLEAMEFTESRGFSQKALGKIRAKLISKHDELLEDWNDYHS